MSVMTPEVRLAVKAASAAAEVILNSELNPGSVRHKGQVNLVTEVDLAAERAIRAVLSAQTPEIQVLGEEEGGGEAATRWVVDPIDGTTNFVHGFPVYGVSVALEVDGQSTDGVVLDPVRGDVYWASTGRGAWCGSERLRVSEVSELSNALVGTGFAYDRRERADFYLSYVKAVMERAQGVRRAGAASMDLVFLASGRLDAFWEFSLSRWDIAAGTLLVTEAGGVVTNHEGAVLDLSAPSPLITNGKLHQEMIALLDGVSERRLSV